MHATDFFHLKYDNSFSMAIMREMMMLMQLQRAGIIGHAYGRTRARLGALVWRGRDERLSGFKKDKHNHYSA